MLSSRFIPILVVALLAAPAPLAAANDLTHLVLKEADYVTNYARGEAERAAPQAFDAARPAFQVALQPHVPMVSMRVFNAIVPGDEIKVALFDSAARPVTFATFGAGVYFFPLHAVDQTALAEGRFLPWENLDAAIWSSTNTFQLDDQNKGVATFTYDGGLEADQAGRSNVLVWVYYEDLGNPGNPFTGYHSGVRTFAWSVNAPFYTTLAYAATPVTAYTYTN